MRPYDWLSELLARFEDEHIYVHPRTHQTLRSAYIILLDPEDWGKAAAQTARFGLRWAAGWADQLDADTFTVQACLVREGDYLLLRTQVERRKPVLPSHTPYYPNADRPERHIQDLWGLAFLDHPDARRWTRHQAWEEDQYPLRQDFPLAGTPSEFTPPDNGYPFLQAKGSAVYEIPVGPVHAGIIEPGHFRFQAVGETVLNLEEHLGYVHKGIEKLAVGRDGPGLIRLAARVSGDATVSHAWAACQAMEQAVGLTIPPRGAWLRGLLLERERVANHLGDIGAIGNDVGFAFSWYQFSRLREQWTRTNYQAFGHRLLMDTLVPGGVARDLEETQQTALEAQIPLLRQEIQQLIPLLLENPSLEDRLETTGILSPTLASRLGCLGYVGRASGQNQDVRRDHPSPPYHRYSLAVPCLDGGDVDARVQIRLQEILASLDLMEQLLKELPAGPVVVPWQQPEEGAEGLGMVEGWRGETLAYLRFGPAGRVIRYFPRDPSWLNWPALERLVRDNIVPDFPVCNKSVNGSYSGHDL